MAHALERNRHTNSRHAYSHPEKDLPEPHSDTARQLVAQSHSHIHFRNGHVSKVPPQECPHYPAMYHSHGTSIAVIHHPTPSCTMSHHPRKTHSLFSCKHISHTGKYRTMYNHSPMWTDTPYLTHRNISTQFPFHTPRWEYLQLHLHRRHGYRLRHVCCQETFTLSPNHATSTKQPSMPAGTHTHPPQTATLLHNV